MRGSELSAGYGMFAATRWEAQKRLEEFIPASGKYGRMRNHVFPFAHDNVSRLSPAIRHRLISEEEAARAPLARYAASTVEKFTQELCWRRYWKSWLSLRPQVWTEYLEDLEQVRNQLSPERQERLNEITTAGSGLAIMDLFTQELLETGYLHNHARMWWAGWFVHVERLPWQLGADFFYRHLLDGDPASNTLSWRWVAGLQTPGKTYLPRRSNLEKYLPPELLAQHQRGLEQLEKPKAYLPEKLPEKPKITRPDLPNPAPLNDAPSLFLIHEDDLLAEQSPEVPPSVGKVVVMADRGSWSERNFSPLKVRWLEKALADGHSRACQKWPNNTVHPEILSFSAETLAQTDTNETPTQVVTHRPEVGPLADRFRVLEGVCEEQSVPLHYLDREEDLRLRNLATTGFFGFWKKLQSRNLLPTAP